jgi:pilus assembly protein CpaF
MTAISKAMKALLEDRSISEIMVDGPDQVYVEREGRLEDVDIHFADDKEILHWINDLLTANGCEPVGRERPWAMERFSDGTYVTVVVPPVAISGPSVTVKKHSRAPFGFDELLQWGCLSQSMLDFFKVVMQAKVSMLISGGTSSGKTTLAGFIVDLAPPSERTVIVGGDEISRFMRVEGGRRVVLETPPGGETSVHDLLHLAQHMRPDRIVYQEFAGEEVVDVMRLMTRGHDGLIATIHAESPRDALSRLETLVTAAEPALTLPAIRTQIAQGVHLIVQQNQLDDGSRRIVSISEVQGLKGDSIVLQELFRWEKTGVGEDERFTGVFKATGTVPSFAPKLAATGLTFPEGTFEKS